MEARLQALVAGYVRRDRGLLALRRAGRTAIVMPAMFAVGDKVLGNPQLATFAAFGSFAMLLLVDFGGPMRDRLQAQAALAGTGAVFVCVGTLVSRAAWSAAVAMTLVGLAVLFSGVVSSVLAGATTSLLLAFILPVSLPGRVGDIGDRLAGWALASVVAWLAVALLWPAPARDPLRGAAVQACRAVAVCLRAQVDHLEGRRESVAVAERQAAVDAVAGLRTVFQATPFRPTGLTTATRTVVRLVDELTWLMAVLTSDDPAGPRLDVTPGIRDDIGAVKTCAAAVLEAGAALLAGDAPEPDVLRRAESDLHDALLRMERSATEQLPTSGPGSDARDRIEEFITSLDPSFRAQELSFAISLVGANVELTAAAERRTFLERVLGRQPSGVTGTLSAAGERAVAHLDLHSVWLHNSIRGALGLGAAVLVANLTGVQHSFWVVLGTLSVLRSSALNTGQNVLRAVVGTAVGFAIGSALLVPIGTDTTVLWVLLPLAILVAGVAPAAISFAAGQAAFTVVLVILFNIIAPAGWRVGLLRIEDIALGCGVSLLVGLLFWPRGAASALGKALAEAYTDSAGYLAAAVDFGMSRCDPGMPGQRPPTAAALTAAAASRRLDDTFRNYLAERGAKPVPLADVNSLITGVAGLRLAGDAVLDLWQRDDGTAPGNRIAARTELLGLSASIRQWYAGLAQSLVAGTAPPPLPDFDHSIAARLLTAVRHDLSGEDGRASATAIRMIWTADHLDAARRLQAGLVKGST